MQHNSSKLVFKEMNVYRAFLFSAPLFAVATIAGIRIESPHGFYTDVLPFFIAAAIFLIFYLPPHSVLEITRQGIRVKTYVGSVKIKIQESNWSDVEKIKIRRYTHGSSPIFNLIKIYTNQWQSRIITLDLLEGEGVKSYYNIKNMLLRYGMPHRHIIPLLEQYWGNKISRVSYFSKSAWERFLLPSHPKDSSVDACFLFLTVIVIGLALVAAVIAVLIFS